MSEKKRKKVYDALIQGAQKGLDDNALYEFVVKRHPKTTSKRIVRASLLALSDPDVKDRKVLENIYALAIKHRLDDGPEEAADDMDDVPETGSEAPALASEQAAAPDVAPHAAAGDPVVTAPQTKAEQDWKEQDDYLEEALEETMPASDPISPGHVHHRDQ